MTNDRADYGGRRDSLINGAKIVIYVVKKDFDFFLTQYTKVIPDGLKTNVKDEILKLLDENI